jgi:hypothetical protein
VSITAAPSLPPKPSDPNPPRGPHDIVLSYGEATKEIERRVGGAVPYKGDPAFAPPGDPLSPGSTKAKAEVIFRDIPLVAIQNSWAVNEATGALRSHMLGIFESSGQLCDTILGDDRIMPTLGSLRAGLFGRDIRFSPANDSSAAREVLDAWVAHWPQFFAGSGLPLMNDYESIMGFADAQLLWDTTKTWLPYMRFWHPRYQYWNWEVRKMVAMTMDGTEPIVHGGGKWVHHSRWGYERCWIRGAIRAVAEPVLGRHWARRDWLRWSEIHGIAMTIAETPMAADPGERAQFVKSLANRGSETTVLAGKGVDEQNSYSVSLVEARDTAWEGFAGLISGLDMAIVLAILFQNLTTEVEGGAFAATKSHMDIRDSGIQELNAAWRSTLHGGVARPFAFFNFGDPELAPVTQWDVASRSQYQANALQFKELGNAIMSMSKGGIKFKDVEEVRAFAATRFGLDGLPDFTIGDPPNAGGGSGGGGEGDSGGGGSEAIQRSSMPSAIGELYQRWRADRAGTGAR